MDYKYNTETLKFYHARYVREYRAICVLWAVLTIIWTILNVVTFIQPHWIGDTRHSPGAGHLGLYSRCSPQIYANRYEYQCVGEFTDFNTISNGSLRAATFFVGFSALLMLLCVAGLLLFFCFKRGLVFFVCGIMQAISGICMFLGCVIFPAGWTGQWLVDLCGLGIGRFKLAECGIRWAYILAILGIFDAVVLAALAFILAAKSAKLQLHDTTSNGTVSKSEINGYSGDTVSIKGSTLQPIQPMMTVPDTDHADGYSEYSHRSEKSKHSTKNFHL